MIEPIGLSTSWNGPGLSPDRLLDEHRGLGFRRLEAYAHFTPQALDGLAQAAQEADMEIGSLHGPCPVAGGLGDWLASTNGSERTRAVDAYKGTIDAAARYGAKAIVVHLGNSGAAPRQGAIVDVVAREGRMSDAHLRLRDQALQERQASVGPHLEAAMDSVRALGEHARGSGVRIGLECRDGYHEIPSLDEFGEIFAAYNDLPVGYWHDAGHGAKLDYLGFVSHEEYLLRYGSRLVGMHIHDTREVRDHQPPGQGTTDFAMLAKYLREDTIRTMELHRTATAAQITQALDALEPYGVFGVAEGILVSS